MTATESPEKLLEILADPKSRAIIAAVAQERQSVAEIADHCDLPLSTSYRRVDTLVDNGILDDTLRMKKAGRHEQEYTLRRESISTGFCVDDTLDIRVSFDATGGEDDRVLRVSLPSYLGVREPTRSD
ncbi:MAG: helix-turn-helix domain-containing protein [Halobacteriales archaeon]|nr:helix-turn-helix domain-containing protein [Halobacteriales archaeon]